jgi:hypothetical protein
MKASKRFSSNNGDFVIIRDGKLYKLGMTGPLTAFRAKYLEILRDVKLPRQPREQLARRILAIYPLRSRRPR